MKGLARSVGMVATILLVGCHGGAGGNNVPAPSGEGPGQASNAVAEQPADGHLDLALAVDGQGGCTYQWQGTPVTWSQLTDLSSTAMRRDVERQGGPANVTSLPQVWVRGAVTIPYSCLGGALHELQRGGVFQIRLVFPARSSDRGLPFVVLELSQAVDGPPPPVEPQKNEIVVTADSRIQWNGQPVDLMRLRQYLDITANMNPTPEAHLKPAPQARLQDVETVLAVMLRANLPALALVGSDLRTGEQFVMYARFYIGPS